jgi:HK97 family phage major capsid protein
MTTEQEQSFDRAMEDFDRLDGQLTRSQRLDDLMDAHMPTPVGTTQDAPVEQTMQHRAFENFIRYGEMSGHLERSNDETRAQGVSSNAAGGFLVPDEFRASIIKATKTFGGTRAHANVITTATGTDLTYPTLDDTGNTGAMIGENTAVTELDVTVGNKILKAYKWTSRMVRVSNELLQDNRYNLESELGTLLGERIGRAQAPYWLTGAGINEPEGLLTNVTAGATLAAGSTVGFADANSAQDALIDMEFAIDQSYLSNASYGMNRTTLSRVRKIRDADGRSIWQQSFAAGAPSTINGYPVWTDPAFPSFGVSQKIAVFGDIRQAYIIRDVAGVTVRRLGERYAEFDQTAFLGFARADAQVQNPAAYVSLVSSAT